MKRILLFLVVLPLNLFANNLPAYYPQNFKQQILKNSNDENIKESLRKVLTSAHLIRKGQADTLIEHCGNHPKAKCYRRKVLSYRQARKILFGKLHLKQNKNGFYIKDVYCNKMYGPGQEHPLKVGPGIIPPHVTLNCEHTWPQAKFSSRYSDKTQVSDLHHLYPSNSRANSTRGHFNFANVEGQVVANDCTASSIGSPQRQSLFRDYHFQPPKNHKGNVARSIFYFSVRYELPIDPVEENFLRQWHSEDPVDAEEMARNNAIQKAQGNRNPFIDMPQLIDRINNF